MQNILHHKNLVFVALIIWLIAGLSGAHGHLCFDGQEPPVSVHMHTLSEHPTHASDEQHLDADVDLSQPLLAKLTKIDLPLLLAAALFLAILYEIVLAIGCPKPPTYPTRRARVCPPLRAPPAH